MATAGCDKANSTTSAIGQKGVRTFLLKLMAHTFSFFQLSTLLVDCLAQQRLKLGNSAPAGETLRIRCINGCSHTTWLLQFLLGKLCITLFGCWRSAIRMGYEAKNEP
jgi:hypothetical protein